MLKCIACSALLAIAELLVFLIGYSSARPTTTGFAALDNSNCVFSVSPDEYTSLEYDLCPLLNRDQHQVSRVVETPPSWTKVSSV